MILHMILYLKNTYSNIISGLSSGHQAEYKGYLFDAVTFTDECMDEPHLLELLW
jgi:hypothetical protein